MTNVTGSNGSTAAPSKAQMAVDPQLLDVLETFTSPRPVPSHSKFWRQQLLLAPGLREACARDARAENPVMEHFAARLLECNHRSRNLGRLVQHTIFSLHSAREAVEADRGTEGPEDGADMQIVMAMNGMRLMSVFVGYLLARTSQEGGMSMVWEHLQPSALEREGGGGREAGPSAPLVSYDASADAGREVLASREPSYSQQGRETYRASASSFSSTSSLSSSSRSTFSFSQQPWSPTSTVSSIVHALLRFLLAPTRTDSPSRPPSFLLSAAHLETVNLLLVLCATQLYGPSPLDEEDLTGRAHNPFMEALLEAGGEEGKEAGIEGVSLVRRILMEFIQEGGPCPGGRGREGGEQAAARDSVHSVRNGEGSKEAGWALSRTLSSMGLSSRWLGGGREGRRERGKEGGKEEGGSLDPSSSWADAPSVEDEAEISIAEEGGRESGGEGGQEGGMEGGKEGGGGMWRSLYSLMRRESAVQAAPGGAREGDASRAASTRPPSSRSPSQAAPTPSTDSTPASLLTSSTGTGSSQSIASLSMAAAAAVASPAAWAGVRRESWQPKSEPEEWARRGRQKRERSLLLLLLLAYQGRGEQRVWNPYRALLETLQDERYQYGEGEEEERPEGGREGGRGGGAPALLRLPFDRLFTAFGRLLPLGEPAPLLFYTLLSSPNPLFLSTSLAQGDVESLLLPLLHQLYRPDRLPSLPPSPRPLYLLLTILLLFSQDSAFNTALFRRHFLPSVPWYKERLLGRTSLGSLALLCLLRALLFALHPAPAPSPKPIPETPSTSPTTSSSSQESTSSLYLLQTSGAILLNLAAQAEHLHDYAALRLTQVLLLLLRRYVRLVDGLPSSSCPPLPLPAAGAVTAAAPSSFPPSSSTSLPSHHPPGHSAALSSYSPPSAASSDPNPSLTHALLSSGLRTLLSFFSIALSPSLLPSNLALVHSLLYSRQHLEPLLAHPAVRALATASFPPSLPPFPSPSHPVQEGGGGGGLGLVPGVLEFFGRLFDETEGTLSVEQAMQVLEKGAREWVGGREGGRAGGLGAGMAADPELKFTYEEETEADSFFVPYIWETIYTITKEDLWWMPQYIQLFGPTPSPSLPPSAPPPRPPPSDAAPSSQGMVRRLLAGTMSVIPTSLISFPPPSRAQNQLSRNGRTSTVDAGAEEDAGRPSITALPVVVTMNV